MLEWLQRWIYDQIRPDMDAIRNSNANLSRRMDVAMASIKDLVEQLAATREEVKRLAAINTANEQHQSAQLDEAMQIAKDTQQIAKQAADNDASIGGSTGKGSV
jgi:hypothetical protein